MGEILKNTRAQKGLTLLEIAKKTKINVKYLEALEKGDYKAFSSLVHIKGFLKIYASFLDLSENEILAFWRREYNTYEISKNEKNIPPKPLKESILNLGPAFFSVVGVGILVLAFLGYLAYQYARFSAPPDLLVSQPQGDLVTETAQIDVFGVASKDAVLTVNGEDITLGEGGEFLVKVPLSEGMNLINIIAKNRLEKETKKTFKIVYERPKPPPEPEPVMPLEEEKKVVDEEESL